MPRIIMNRAFIARWTRMPHSTGRLSASASSNHSLSSAAFITNIAESDFRHTQVEPPHDSHRFSADWATDNERRAAARRAEQQRIADYYRRTTKEQEDRE